MAAGSVRRRGGAKRKVIAYLAVSVDGYLAAPGGSCDWLDPYADALAGFPAFMKSIGAIVMGRGTYDFMLKQPMAAAPFGRTPMHVLSHRKLPELPGAEVVRHSGSVKTLVARLTTPKHIWVTGGGIVLREFLKADLIDRWQLFVSPVILGDGIPMLPKLDFKVRSLKMSRCTSYKSGVVELCYERP